MADTTFTYGPGNIDQLLTTTMSIYVDKNLNDQIFNAMPFYQKLKNKSKSQDGGASLLVPVLYEKNSTAQSYDGYDILNTLAQDGMTTTQAKWKQLAVSVSVSGRRLRQNSGQSKIIEIVQAKTNQAIESLRDKISTQLFASTTGSKDVRSLVTMIDATSTIQDVNSTNNSWWQSTVTAGGSFAAQGLDDMRTTVNTVDQYKPASVVDTIVTTSDVYNYYEASIAPGMRYSVGDKGDPTFQSLIFRGAEVFQDVNCTSGVMYMFSSDDLYLVVNSNADMKTSEFVKPSDQDAKVAQIFFMGELVTRARRKLAKITSITA